MKFLIWIHVISAIVGVGPTFAIGLFFQKNQSISELKHSIRLVNKALYFNKIGAPIAFLSGIALMLTGNYGSWMQLWIIGAILIYLLIMVLSIPLGKKLTTLQEWSIMQNEGEKRLPQEQEKTLKQMHGSVNVIHLLSIILFSLMILKPIVF